MAKTDLGFKAALAAPVLTMDTPISKEEKFKRIAALAKTLNDKHETTNSLVRLGDKRGVMLPSTPTGLPTVDYELIQTGGIPKGRVIEVFGPESAGKTSWTLHCIAECQAQGGVAAFVDAEHALDPNYATVFGVNIDELVVSQPDNGEDALDTVDALIESRAADLIVVDSVSALVPKAELAGDIGDSHVGLQARLMSQALRIITGKASKAGITVIFINQIREKIGTMYGNPETTSGGRALKFYASIRIDVRRQQTEKHPAIKVGDELIGHTIRLKAVKNKVGVPFREAFVDLYYTSGFDKEASLIEYADHRGLFEKSGSWYSIGGERIANGLANLKKTLKDRPEVLAKVKAEVQKALTADAEVAKQ